MVKKSYLRFITLALSILFIIVGIYRNEAVVAFKKAINVCLECIGIG